MAARPSLLPSAILLVLAGCGNMTCDQQKQEAIKHMNLGVEAANTKSFTGAEKEFALATSLDPENHKAWYSLGQVQEDQKKWDKAEQAFENAIKYSPKDPMYQYHLGRSQYEQQKYDKARLALEQATTLNKRLYKAYFYLGKIHAAEDRPKEAADAWTESCRLNPGFGKPFYELGKLYYQWDHPEQAVQVLQQGSANARDAEDLADIYNQLGMSYDTMKQPDKSIDAYSKALDARKDHMQARFQLGMAYATKGDKANARKYLDEFLKQGGGGDPYLIQGANDRLMKLAAE